MFATKAHVANSVEHCRVTKISLGMLAQGYVGVVFSLSDMSHHKSAV